MEILSNRDYNKIIKEQEKMIKNLKEFAYQLYMENYAGQKEYCKRNFERRLGIYLIGCDLSDFNFK